MSSENPNVTYLAVWAAKWGAALQLEGECGFGRECVGITKGSGYLDYAHIWDLDPDLDWWAPADAYHKHDCLAVLGRGDDAVLRWAADNMPAQWSHEHAMKWLWDAADEIDGGSADGGQ